MDLAALALTVVKFPFKLIGSVFSWGKGVFTAPGRLKALEAVAKASGDPRPTCMKCGKGRVAVTISESLPNSHMRRTIGVCDAEGCGARWWTTDDGCGLRRPEF